MKLGSRFGGGIFQQTLLYYVLWLANSAKHRKGRALTLKKKRYISPKSSDIKLEVNVDTLKSKGIK